MRSCMSWSEISTSESKWIYLELDSPLNTVWSVILLFWQWTNAFRSIRYAVESGCHDSIDLGSPLTSSRNMDLAEMILDHPFRFLELLRPSEMLVKHIWLLLVSTWDTPALWGQCLRIFWPLGIWSGSLFCDLCSCDYWLTFGYCSKRTTLALWLLNTGHQLRSQADLLSMWDTSTLWGQCLRILFSLQIFDLEGCIMIFMPVTCCWLLVMTVSELL